MTRLAIQRRLRRTPLLSFLCLAATILPAFTQSTLVQKTILDGRITMLLPQDFTIMSEEMLRLKYPSERRPTLVYTNDRGSVNIAFNHTQNVVSPDQIVDMHKALETMFKAVYPSATWYRSEVISRAGWPVILFDLVTPALDTQVRNIIMAMSVQGRILLISFNTTKELEAQWIGPIQKMLNSIKVRG